MKLKIFFVVLLLGASLSLFAQDKDTNEEDNKDWDKPMKTKIGGAGGMISHIAFFDNAGIDKTLKVAGLPVLGSDPIYLVGGEGYGYIMFLKNVRFGGFGVQGSKTVSSIQNLGGTLNLKKEVEYTVSYSGFLVDYVLPIADKLDLSAGLTIGSGNVNIRMTRDDNSAKIWDSVWTEYGSITSQSRNYTRKLTGSFAVVNPHASIEYALLRWMQLRVGVSYPIMFSPEWKLDDKFLLDGVPSSIKTNGYTITAGLMFGFFN